MPGCMISIEILFESVNIVCKNLCRNVAPKDAEDMGAMLADFENFDDGEVLKKKGCSISCTKLNSRY